MATYDELATNYANNAKQEYENSLSYLTTDIKNQQALDQSALQQKYDNLLTQINRQNDVINKQYESDAQAAYINKMLANKALDTSLSQLGVDTQGFGVNQRLLNENAYGQNLAALQQTRAEGLQGVADKATDTMADYNVASTQLNSDYLAKLSAMNQYIQEQANAYQQNQYTNYLNDLKYQDALKQQEYENQLAERQYQDQLAQQLWENQFKQQQLDEQRRQADLDYSLSISRIQSGDSQYSKGVVGYGELASSSGDGQGNVIYTDINGNQYKMKQGYNPYTGTKADLADKGTFSNGYQPTHVRINDEAVQLRTAKKDGWSINGHTQTIWQAGKSYYVWDGTQNRYYKLSKAQEKEAGLR